MSKRFAVYFLAVAAALCMSTQAGAVADSVTAAITVGRDCDSSSDNCVAPLAMHFHARSTTCEGDNTDECDDTASGFANSEFHNLHYTWDFDDSGAGTWAVSGQSKNVEYGPEAAHVFDNDGTYTVKVTACSAQACDDATTTVVVVDPNDYFDGTGGNPTTLCVYDGVTGAGTLGTGCPEGSSTLNTDTSGDNWDDVITDALTAGHRRILFKAGDTFTFDARLNLNNPPDGPVHIGSYGTYAANGDRAIINATSFEGSAMMLVLNAGNDDVSDWRFADLVINNKYPLTNPATTNSTLYWGSPGTDHFINSLFYNIKKMRGGSFLIATETASAKTGVPAAPVGLFVVENEFNGENYGIYMATKQGALLGNITGDPDMDGDGEGYPNHHMWRIGSGGHWEDMIIAHNQVKCCSGHNPANGTFSGGDTTIRGASALDATNKQEFDDADVDTTNDEIYIPSHGFTDEEGPARIWDQHMDGTSLPTGISIKKDYYIVTTGLTNTPATDYIGLSLTAGGSKIDIGTATGGETYTVYPDGNPAATQYMVLRQNQFDDTSANSLCVGTDNPFECCTGAGEGCNGWNPISIRCRNPDDPEERLQDIIVENNQFGVALHIDSTKTITARNNVFVPAGYNGRAKSGMIWVHNLNAGQSDDGWADDVMIYNNSGYSTETNSAYGMVSVENRAEENCTAVGTPYNCCDGSQDGCEGRMPGAFVVKNNVLWVDDTDVEVYQCDDGSDSWCSNGTTASNLDRDDISSSPYDDSTPEYDDPADWRITGSSASSLINAGADLGSQVYMDLEHHDRGRYDSSWDIGAMEAICTTWGDADGDTVVDTSDNCLNVSNADQYDSCDGEGEGADDPECVAAGNGYGNACEADFDNNGGVGISDYTDLSEYWGGSCSDSAPPCTTSCSNYDADVDVTQGGCGIGITEFGLYNGQFGKTLSSLGLKCDDL